MLVRVASLSLVLLLSSCAERAEPGGLTGEPSPQTAAIELRSTGDVEIRLDGDGDAESISVGHPPEEEFGPLVDEREVPIRNGRAQLDLDAGRYVLVVFARWLEGDAVLTFGLDVA